MGLVPLLMDRHSECHVMIGRGAANRDYQLKGFKAGDIADIRIEVFYMDFDNMLIENSNPLVRITKL
ncbi:hypothetical protein GVAMD_0328 [Gardnerella vaginalis AMD]|nr:hypothetical protein GVAMD_0328 [Gardnerella vaginalis AMD]